MAGELAAAGLQSRVAPLLAAQPTGEPFPTNRYDHVIFVSEHAVTHANKAYLAANNALAGLAPQARWYAVGPATDAALVRVFAANRPAGKALPKLPEL